MALTNIGIGGVSPTCMNFIYWRIMFMTAPCIFPVCGKNMLCVRCLNAKGNAFKVFFEGKRLVKRRLLSEYRSALFTQLCEPPDANFSAPQSSKPSEKRFAST
jgi:hypothetical protein